MKLNSVYDKVKFFFRLPSALIKLLTPYCGYHTASLYDHLIPLYQGLNYNRILPCNSLVDVRICVFRVHTMKAANLASPVAHSGNRLAGCDNDTPR